VISCIVPLDIPLGRRLSLKLLPWFSGQDRFVDNNYINRGLIIGKVANSVHDCIQDLLFDCVAIDAMRPGSIDKQLG